MSEATESAIVAVFRNSSGAQAAAAELIASAFAGDHIHVATAALTAPSEDTVTQPHAGRQEPDVQHWLESVFVQAGELERQHYEDAVHSGMALLGVSTPQQMIGEAADILNHHAPVEMILARVPQAITRIAVS